MWKWGAYAFGLYTLASIGLSVAWLIRKDQSRRSAWTWAPRFCLWASWVSLVGWAIWREPTLYGWLWLCLGAGFNLTLNLLCAFSEVRKGSLFEAIAALFLLLLSPVTWAFVCFYWPYLDGAGLLMGLVLPFSTAYFRETMEAFEVGLLLTCVLVLAGWVRAVWVRRPRDVVIRDIQV